MKRPLFYSASAQRFLVLAERNIRLDQTQTD